MSSRNLFLGFGAGLVVAAGFLSLFSPQPQPSGSALTKDQLRSAAEAQNYVLVEKDDYQRLTEEKKAAENPSSQPPVPPKPPQSTVQTQPNLPAKPAASPVSSAPKKPEAPVQMVSVTIPYAATAEDVEKLLVKAGVLQKENKLIGTLRDRDKLDRIRVGTYQLAKGANEDQIVSLITTPPKK